MNGNTRTLAFQVSEELFQRVKNYLSKHPSLTQKSFVIGLIEAELKRFEEEPAPAPGEEELRRQSFDPLTGEYEYPAGQGGAEEGETPQGGAEEGEIPQGSAEEGETPQDGAEDGETPQGGAEEGDSHVGGDPGEEE